MPARSSYSFKTLSLSFLTPMAQQLSNKTKPLSTTQSCPAALETHRKVSLRKFLGSFRLTNPNRLPLADATQFQPVKKMTVKRMTKRSPSPPGVLTSELVPLPTGTHGAQDISYFFSKLEFPDAKPNNEMVIKVCKLYL